MPVTQTDIDNLTRAIASGERQVTIGSQSVTYRSITDLILARDTLIRELAQQEVAAGNATPRPKAYNITQAGKDYD